VLLPSCRGRALTGPQRHVLMAAPQDREIHRAGQTVRGDYDRCGASHSTPWAGRGSGPARRAWSAPRSAPPKNNSPIDSRTATLPEGYTETHPGQACPLRAGRNPRPHLPDGRELVAQGGDGRLPPAVAADRPHLWPAGEGRVGMRLPGRHQDGVLLGDDPTKLQRYAGYADNSGKVTSPCRSAEAWPAGPVRHARRRRRAWCLDSYDRRAYARFPADQPALVPLLMPTANRFAYLLSNCARGSAEPMDFPPRGRPRGSAF
jgi:hypothetical protein